MSDTYLHTNTNKENYLLTPSDAGDLCVAKLYPSQSSTGSASAHSVRCEASRNLKWFINNTGIQNPVYKLTLPNPDSPQQDQPLFQVSKPNPNANWWTLFYFTYAGHLIPPKRIEFGRIQKNSPEAGGGTRVSITGKTDDEKAVWKTLGEANEDMVEWIVICAALVVLDNEIVAAATMAGISAGTLPTNFPTKPQPASSTPRIRTSSAPNGRDAELARQPQAPPQMPASRSANGHGPSDAGPSRQAPPPAILGSSSYARPPPGLSPNSAGNMQLEQQRRSQQSAPTQAYPLSQPSATPRPPTQVAPHQQQYPPAPTAGPPRDLRSQQVVQQSSSLQSQPLAHPPSHDQQRRYEERWREQSESPRADPSIGGDRQPRAPAPAQPPQAQFRGHASPIPPPSPRHNPGPPPAASQAYRTSSDQRLSQQASPSTQQSQNQPQLRQSAQQYHQQQPMQAPSRGFAPQQALPPPQFPRSGPNSPRGSPGPNNTNGRNSNPLPSPSQPYLTPQQSPYGQQQFSSSSPHLQHYHQQNGGPSSRHLEQPMTRHQLSDQPVVRHQLSDEPSKPRRNSETIQRGSVQDQRQFQQGLQSRQPQPPQQSNQSRQPSPLAHPPRQSQQALQHQQRGTPPPQTANRSQAPAPAPAPARAQQAAPTKPEPQPWEKKLDPNNPFPKSTQAPPQPVTSPPVSPKKPTAKEKKGFSLFSPPLASSKNYT